jgi:F-type H+-transporting ATPase subunit delta
MSDFTTAARPYAKAVFELGSESKTLEKWSSSIAFMAAVASDAQMQAALASPKLAQLQRADVFLAACKGDISKEAENLVRVLAENNRLVILPNIAEQFEELRASAENIVDATIISASALSASQSKAYAAALEKRLGKKVQLKSEVDENLLGGAVIRAGDSVIDGSLKGRMQQLAHELLSN